MDFNDLIFKRLAEFPGIALKLATFSGAPAVFNSEFPSDEQAGWGDSQYPRISFRTDMQTNQERSADGVLQISVYSDKESLIIDEIEDAVKRCLQDVLMKPSDEAPFCVSWMKTEGYRIEGTEVICQNVVFDILEYSSQITTDPDPVLAVSNYLKELYPNVNVLGVDKLGDVTLTTERPAFYCRLVNIQKTTGHCEHSISWMLGKMAVHLICPNPEMRLQMLSEIYRRIAIDEEIIMLDDSPMEIKELVLDNKADYLREGQLTVVGKYGCLKTVEKKQDLRYFSFSIS